MVSSLKKVKRTQYYADYESPITVLLNKIKNMTPKFLNSLPEPMAGHSGWLDIFGSLLEDNRRLIRLMEGPFVVLA